jgi:hypothetical protein
MSRLDEIEAMVTNPVFQATVPEPLPEYMRLLLDAAKDASAFLSAYDLEEDPEFRPSRETWEKAERLRTALDRLEAPNG